ncbi:CGNR zinc finger domain-containing protein [Kribbella solani]|uniref:CGNR zinc finger domain-containing protein n=1 Tax=Kribbella solani TaxID=236067 RepID=UPI0029AC67B6|nr:CGNR zinc finger domain-containing protein [Kribbella solani]MDX2968741.1 CGNR zinc finger domain-containing protein [Kribbella solani]
MDATDHLKASLAAAVGLSNLFGAEMRQGRVANAPTAEAIREVLLLTTNRLPELIVDDYAAGGRLLYDAFSSLPDVDPAVDLVNRLLIDTQAAPRLTRREGTPWHLHFGSPDEARGWLAEFATAAAMLLGSDEKERLRKCEAARCDNLFLDSTRNRTQRFCSTACQNRTKVAAHRARTA